MVKTKPLSHGKPFSLSDIFGLTRGRGNEIAAKLNILLRKADKKSEFIEAALSQIDLKSDEEQAFLFACIGQVL